MKTAEPQPPGEGSTITQGSARSQATFDLLRHLAQGLSVYRLFPDDSEQDGFVAAVERIRGTAERALALKGGHVEIRSGRFRDADGSELSDEHIDRLAAACFERGVEFLAVRDVPSRADLRATFQALSMTPEELADVGGVGSVLEHEGVITLRLGDVTPEAGEGAGRQLDDLTAEQLDVWRTVLDPERFAANLLVEGLSSNPAEAAQDVYARLETASAVLPVARSADPEFVQSLVRIVESLPQGVQREFGAHAITRAREGDELARNYLGSMTDPELANVLVDLQEAAGPDARDIAEELIREVGRQPGLVEIAASFLEARGLAEPSEDDGDVGPMPLAPGETGGPEDDSVTREVAADVFASRLVDATDRDVGQLLADYPEDQQLRDEALNAFLDYVLNESDEARLGQALETWADHLREALRAGEQAAADSLLHVVEQATGQLERSDLRRLVEISRASVLDASLLDVLVERAKHGEAATAEVLAVLERFADTAQEALLDRLAEEEERGTRAVLVTLIAGLLGEDVEPLVSRLRDDRWYVVRNIATILGRLDDGAGFAHLPGMLSHPNVQVRREVVRALPAAGGSDAVPFLERLTRDDDERVRTAATTALGSLVSANAAEALGRVVDAQIDQDTSRRAIDELRRHGAPVAGEVLEDLASRRRRPKLPRAVRRHAKSRLSERKANR